MNQDLCIYRIRLKKEDSSMLYFILESCENIAFYSTLKDSIDPLHRDIEVNCHISLKAQLDNILDHFSKKYKIQYIS